MIHVIDLHFQGFGQTIASFLVETEDGPVLIETGPHSTFDQLEIGIQKIGYDIKDIQHVFLTHIHFDHAGAAWALANQGAKIYVHPFGAKHLAHPEKFVESARRIYQDQMDPLWGKIEPIPENKIQSVHEQEIVQVGKKQFKAWHTPGHAVHHIAWQLEDQLFTGDVAGVNINNGIVIPPCPPPDINIADWQASIATIKSIAPQKIWLTHFGPYDNVNNHLDELEKRLLAWADWMKKRWESGDDPESVKPEFQNFVAHKLSKNGVSEAGIQQYETANPSWMGVAGLMRYWKKQQEKSKG